MTNGAEVRRYGRVFNAIAGEYDRHRQAYPDTLIDRACKVGGLPPGARVLEIGCGTGQLTRSLLARGLLVTAVEPGEQLIAVARERLAGTDAGEARFLNARLEDATLPAAHYQAAFAASAIHWVDPDVGWEKLAGAVVDNGTIALLSHFGVQDPRAAEDQKALRAALGRIAPELAAEWPAYRDLDDTLAGVAQRSENVSAAWAWLGSYEVARRPVSDLFENVQVAALPALLEQSADALNALLGTMSFWACLSPAQRDQLAAEVHALEQRLGRPIRSSTIACLVTARRTPRT